MTSLFYADDGMLLATCEEQAVRSVEVVRSVGEKYGLKINVRKSKCMIFNSNRDVREIGGMQVVPGLKYLGVNLVNKRNLLEEHRRGMIEVVRRMSNMVNSVIEKSCHRVLIGKTYWKGVVLPKVLFGAEAVNIRELEIEKLQRAENGTMRRILRAPRYATIAAMRGEIGMGTMKSRIVRGRLQYLRRVMQGDNVLLKRMVGGMLGGRDTWMGWNRKYLEWADVRLEDLRRMGRNELRNRIGKIVERNWMQEMESKSTLRLYREYKLKMEEVDYDGGVDSMVWFRARTNCLWLNDRRVEEDGRGCRLCGGMLEDLEHFVLDCAALERDRIGCLELQRPRMENSRGVLGSFLFGGGEELGRRRVMAEMWKRRRTKLEEIE